MTGSLPDDTKTNQQFASSLLNRLEYNDAPSAPFFQNKKNGLVDPKFINALKGCDMHQSFCEGYVANLIETMKQGLPEKIAERYESQKEPRVAGKALKVSSEFLERQELELKKEHIKNSLVEAEDELAALGNLMLVEACMAHGFDPCNGSRFLFHHEENPNKGKKRKA